MGDKLLFSNIENYQHIRAFVFRIQRWKGLNHIEIKRGRIINKYIIYRKNNIA